MTPDDLVMHSASAQSILWIDKSFCSLEIRNVVSSIYSYFTSLETAIYSSHSDERLADEHVGINGNQWIYVHSYNVALVKSKAHVQRCAADRIKKLKVEASSFLDVLELNNKRQYHHSQGGFQSHWKNALKAEDGLSTFPAVLFHVSFFLKTWRKRASSGEKRKPPALISSPSIKWWLCST